MIGYIVISHCHPIIMGKNSEDEQKSSRLPYIDRIDCVGAVFSRVEQRCYTKIKRCD
jgi:hypothetical protein